MSHGPTARSGNRPHQVGPASHAVVPEAALEEIRAIVGAANVRTGEAVAAIDPGWNPFNFGAGLVVAPGSTAEVALVVGICGRHAVPIVPQGGRTGLVGGSVSKIGEVVLSLGRMNRIERLDPVERVAVVEAGVTLAALQAAALDEGLEPGIDLAARGSATIGGMVSTNAGGVMAFRNGVMRHRVLGLEAVLADGSVFSDLTRVVKNSAGYDLKHLFIGAEGTLGIITRIVLKLDPMPRATATAMFGLPTVGAALETIRLALNSEAGHLRAAEALWRSYIKLTASAHGWSEPGFDLDQPISTSRSTFCCRSAVGGRMRCATSSSEYSPRFWSVSQNRLALSQLLGGRKMTYGGCARTQISSIALILRLHLTMCPCRCLKSMTMSAGSWPAFAQSNPIFPPIFSGIWPTEISISCSTGRGR
jgi:FAD/FMN-containing dehydrogenase